MKHFKLTTESKVNSFGITLFRIEATVDSKWAKKGDKGGWIEKESNLSGNAWVSDNARVYGNASVYNNARVYGNASVYNNAWVYDNASVYGNAKCTSLAMTLNFKWSLTLTDNHILYGCIQKTIDEWKEWLKGLQEYETPRDSEEFKIIEMALNLAIEYRRQNPIE